MFQITYFSSLHFILEMFVTLLYRTLIFQLSGKFGSKIGRFRKAIAKNPFLKNKGNLHKSSKFFEHVLFTE